jgi:hypothetical protein
VDIPSASARFVSLEETTSGHHNVAITPSVVMATA